MYICLSIMGLQLGFVNCLHTFLARVAVDANTIEVEVRSRTRRIEDDARMGSEI